MYLSVTKSTKLYSCRTDQDQKKNFQDDKQANLGKLIQALISSTSKNGHTLLCWQNIEGAMSRCIPHRGMRTPQLGGTLTGTLQVYTTMWIIWDLNGGMLQYAIGHTPGCISSYNLRCTEEDLRRCTRVLRTSRRLSHRNSSELDTHPGLDQTMEGIGIHQNLILLEFMGFGPFSPQ